MKRYEGILLCTDLDGTLRNSSGKITEENISAVKYFMENGGRFTLCTGRSSAYANDLKSEGLEFNAPLIVLNGAMLYDIKSKKILYRNPIDMDKINGINDFIEENKSLYTRIDFHSVNTVSDYNEIQNNVLYKAVFVSETPKTSAELRKRLEKRYPKGFCIINSWATGLEILDEKSTKGNGVIRIKNHIDADIKKIVCVGDYENDISMLKIADISYAVSNAIDSVKAAADRITVSNDEHALKKIIEEL